MPRYLQSPNVLHDDRADNMDLHHLKIDALPRGLAIVRESFQTNCSTSPASTPLEIAVVGVCERDFRWTTSNRPDRFCEARCREVNDDAIECLTVFAAMVSTSHSLALGRDLLRVQPWPVNPMPARTPRIYAKLAITPGIGSSG
jgi:hypothetical protein